MQEIYLTGYVLHSRPYRETSSITSVFSREIGKVSFVAKGIRAKKNPKIALLQPLQKCQLSVVGNAELKTLRNIELIEVAIPLQEKKLFCSMYVNELLMKLLPTELQFQSLFSAYESLLQKLAATDAIEPILREFEFTLLTELGYGQDLTWDQSAEQPIEANKFYQFDPEQGLTPVNEHNVTGLKGALLLDIARLNWHADSLRCAKQINRFALQHVLGGKPLKSRELFG